MPADFDGANTQPGTFLPHPQESVLIAVILCLGIAVEFDAYGVLRSHGGLDGGNDLGGKPEAVFRRTSIKVVPVVKKGTDKLAEQVSVGTVELYSVIASPLGSGSGVGKLHGYSGDFVRSHDLGGLAGVGGGHTRWAGGHVAQAGGAAMIELDKYLPSGLVDGLCNLAVPDDTPTVTDTCLCTGGLTVWGDECHFRDDETNLLLGKELIPADTGIPYDACGAIGSHCGRANKTVSKRDACQGIRLKRGVHGRTSSHFLTQRA